MVRYVFLFLLLVHHAVGDLFISEYGEGASSNKWLEIYNPTDQTVDLSGYGYPQVNNAPSTPGQYEYWYAFASGASIPPKGTYLIAHPSAPAAELAHANETNNYLSNGDDGFCLVKGTESSYTILDCVGDWEADPGSGWAACGVSDATMNHVLVRKSTVCSGAGYDWATSAGTNADNCQWIVYEQNEFTHVGSHTTSCGTNPAADNSASATDNSCEQFVNSTRDCTTILNSYNSNECCGGESEQCSTDVLEYKCEGCCS